MCGYTLTYLILTITYIQKHRFVYSSDKALNVCVLSDNNLLIPIHYYYERERREKLSSFIRFVHIFNINIPRAARRQVLTSRLINASLMFYKRNRGLKEK